MFAESSAANQQLDAVGLEPAQPCFDQLVAALRDGRVARIDGDAERTRRLRPTPRRGDQSHAVSEHRRTEHRQKNRGGEHGGEHPAVRPQLSGVDRASIVGLVDALERGTGEPLDQSAGERIAPRRPRARPLHLHRGEHGGLERMLMLLEIQRHLIVAELGAEAAGR